MIDKMISAMAVMTLIASCSTAASGLRGHTELKDKDGRVVGTAP